MKESQEDKPERIEPTKYLGVGLSPGRGFMERCLGLSRNGLSPKPFGGVGKGAYFVTWFGMSGVSFSLISLVSWVGVGDITGCSVPRSQSGDGRSSTLWFRVFDLFSPS